ncbi:MAG: molybdenum cofactor guanylyltransferase MobA [Acetobacteraceae bacterium]|nr:molybdenum cofactor guanylyltransferase MobA [Acetobacteraceae bacterium]
MSSPIPPQDAHCAVAAPPVAVILAGGQARRMGGGDKPLRLLDGRTLLDHVLARIVPQVAAVALSANGDPARFAAWGLPVLPDPVPGTPGPLAGVLAGLRWARQQGADDLLVVPGDTPFLPHDLVARLRHGRGGAALSCAASGGRLHPVVALWRVALEPALAAALAAGERRVQAWMRGRGLAEIDFAITHGDPFANLNTPEDLAAAGQDPRLRPSSKPHCGGQS